MTMTVVSFKIVHFTTLVLFDVCPITYSFDSSFIYWIPSENFLLVALNEYCMKFLDLI